MRRADVFDWIAWYLSRREIDGITKKLQNLSIQEIYDKTEHYIGRGNYASIRTVQVAREMLECLNMLRSRRIGIVLEIGTYKGGTLFLWSQALPNVSKIISVDLPGGNYGGGYHPNRRKLYRRFAGSRKIEYSFIQSDSHRVETVREVEQRLNNKCVDLLYLDGDHTYEGVKMDYDIYSQYVKQGLIVFHDIVTRTSDCGVWRLWSELKMTHETLEFVHPGSNKGIGVVFVAS